MTNTNVLVPTFELEIVKVSGKRITTTLFRQLYIKEPFDNEYELEHSLKGKIFFQGKEYVLFTAPEGIRKFDISHFNNKIKIKPLVDCLYHCLIGIQTMELNHIKREVLLYFNKRRFEYDYHTSDRDVLDSFFNEGKKTFLNDGIKRLLVDCLEADFKEMVESEYEKGLKRIENFNRLSDVFKTVPQLYL